MTNIDLRPFLRAMGGTPTRAPLDVPERDEPDDPAELLEEAPQKVATPPASEAVFIDGIQLSTVLTYRSHRPVTLVAAAAGAVDANMEPQYVVENYEVLCGRDDLDWIVERECPLAVRVVCDSREPVEVERATAADLRAARDGLEILVTADMLDDLGDGHSVVVDGHLAGRPADHRLTGVIKSTNSRLLQDESVLWDLPEGWRSPKFKVPTNHGGPSAQRYSCYVRLRPASNRPWSYGLVRVETYDPDLLDQAAATALAFRQPAGTHDTRGDRHLAPIAMVERWLRSRRPAYL